MSNIVSNSSIKKISLYNFNQLQKKRIILIIPYIILYHFIILSNNLIK
jgi:hypothetical protein